jgi:hypothetical protein
MPSSRRPVDAYKAIVDQLVNETTHSVMQQLVTERGFFLETSDYAVFNKFVHLLTPEQRRLLGDMLLQERWGTIHDVLAVLTSWMSSDGLAFAFQGEPMPVDLSGTGDCTVISLAAFKVGSGQTTAVRPTHKHHLIGSSVKPGV